MGLQDDFINSFTGCMSPFPFPSITQPGLGNFALATFGAVLAPITFVLSFIPPDPLNLPTIPSISICIAPFMASLMMPPSYPGIDINLGGVDISIPGVGSAPYQRDVSGELKLAVVCIALPFLLIKKFIDDLLNLQISLPTLDGITALLTSLLAEIGLSGLAITHFITCLPQAVLGVFTSLI